MSYSRLFIFICLSLALLPPPFLAAEQSFREKAFILDFTSPSDESRELAAALTIDFETQLSILNKQGTCFRLLERRNADTLGEIRNMEARRLGDSVEALLKERQKSSSALVFMGRVQKTRSSLQILLSLKNIWTEEIVHQDYVVFTDLEPDRESRASKMKDLAEKFCNRRDPDEASAVTEKAKRKAQDIVSESQGFRWSVSPCEVRGDFVKCQLKVTSLFQDVRVATVGNSATAIDDSGNEYGVLQRGSFGARRKNGIEVVVGNGTSTLVSELPTPVTVTFSGLPHQVLNLKLLKIYLRGPDAEFVFRDVPLVRK